LLKAAGQKVAATPPILELNPQHPLVQRLQFEEAKLADWAQLLFEQAQLAEGGQLDDPAAFVRRVNELLLDAAAKK
jgi:molecular chaperone HtpG